MLNMDTAAMVPHLTTALDGPLQHLEGLFLDQQTRIEAWFRQRWLETPAPFYASVDLRNAGFKLAPVDTNLFPAGFNNLNPAFAPLGVQAIQVAVEHALPSALRVLLIAEDHTRNTFYMENLAALRDLLVQAGLETRIGSLRADLTTAQTIALPSGREVLLEPVRRDGDKVGVGDFFPCMILLNNDLAAGRPEALECVDQLLIPPLGAGWSDRLKSEHFTEYRDVSQQFSELLDIDPWLVSPLFRNCGEINFSKREGEECLADNVAALLEEVRRKYREYGVSRAPFVMVKADAGTYGMGIMAVHSAEELLELNRKQRNKMNSAKGGRDVSNVIMQEGVFTFETWGDGGAIAEPVVYMIDHYVIGGFYRVHEERSDTENLNAPGMRFEPLAFADSCNTPDPACAPDAGPNRFYAYGVIARLAALAAAQELAGMLGQDGDCGDDDAQSAA